MVNLTITRSATPLLYPATGEGIEVWRDVQGAITAYGEISDSECWMHLPGIASYLLPLHQAEDCVAFANGTEEGVIIDAYRRRVLPMALHLKGWEVVHASGIRSARGVIAFCAPSETGKSTIACGLSCRGYGLWADDALAFRVSGNAILTTAMPFEMRLRSSASELLRDCHQNTPVAVNGRGTTENLVALCVLRRMTSGDQRVSIRRLRSAEALEAILPHAWCFTLRDVERKRQMVNSYLDLAARTTVFDVCFQPGLENLPMLLDTLEDRLRPFFTAQSIQSDS